MEKSHVTISRNCLTRVPIRGHGGEEMRAISIGLVLLAGCVAGGAAPTPMEVSRECVEEETCDDRQAQCFEDRRRRCDACSCEGLHWDLVDECLRSCNRICTTPCPSCGPDSPAHCTAHEFVARLPEPRNERVYASCRGAWDRMVSECGVSAPASDVCDTYARTERPEVADWYDCIAASPCGERSGCYPEPDPSLVAHVCDRDDVECADDFREGLASATPWLKDDVVAALLDCDRHTSSDWYLGCVNAWVKAVFPQ